MGTKSCTKSSQDFQMAGNVLFGKILAQDFQMAAVTKILMRRENQLRRFFSLGDKQKTHETQNAHGDHDAAIVKAAATVTHVQT